MASDGSIIIDVDLNKKELEQSLGKLSGTVNKALKGLVATAGTAAIALGTATVALGKQAIMAYADYEQLVGGVDTLFKDSSKTVQGYANNAYKTAGLSANKYMETVTSFSASLLQSLDGDTKKAAKAADMAITDMADNANKMGTAIESIQWAYQGFAKGNYGMLDNLKLGYGGTKSEMERLLKDAQKLSGVKYDMSNLNDVYSAIHVIQTEIGITGTTALEASSTIQGSAASMKAAWENLLTGIADENQDFDVLLDNFMQSVGTFAKNLIPRIEVAFEGIVKLAKKIIPQITAMLPPEYAKIVKGIVDLGRSFIKVFEAIVKHAKTIVIAFASIKAAQGTAFAVKNIQRFASVWGVASKAVDRYMVTLLASSMAGVKNTATLTAQQAIVGGLTGKLNAATVAQATFGKVLKSSLGPIGLIITAIGAVTAGFTLWAKTQPLTEQQKLNKEVREGAKYLDEYNASMGELGNTRANELAGVDSQMDKIEALSDELGTLVDSNGKVKKGDEDRVKYILGQLNPALGVEMELTEGQISNYKDYQGQVEKLIAVKRLERGLDAMRPEVDEAEAARPKILENYSKSVERVSGLNKQVEDSLAGLKKQFGEDFDPNLTPNKATEGYANLVRQLEEAETQLNDNKTALIENSEVLDRYAKGEEALASGNIEKIQQYQQVIDNLRNGIVTFQEGITLPEEVKKATDNAVLALDKFLVDALDNGGNLKAGYETTFNDLKAAVVSQIGEMEKAGIELPQHIKDALAEGTPEAIQIVIDYFKNGSIELGKEGETAGNNYAEGMESTKGNAENSASGISSVVKAALESGDTTTLGVNIILGLIKGINSKKVDAVKAAEGVSLAVKTAMDVAFIVKSPSRWAMRLGKYIDEGLAAGLVRNAELLTKASSKITSNLKDSITAGSKEVEQALVGVLENLDKVGEDMQVKQAKLALSQMEIRQHHYQKELEAKMKETEKSLEILSKGNVKETKSSYDKELDKLYKQLEKASLSKRGAIMDKIKALELKKEQEIAKMKNKITTEGLKVRQEDIKKQQELLEEQKKAIEDWKKEYEKAIDAITAKQTKFEEKLLSTSELIKKTTGDVEGFDILDIEQMDKDIERFKQYGDQLAEMRKRGVSDSIFAQIEDMGVDEGMAFTEALLGKNEEEFNAYMAKWEERNKMAGEVAKQTYAGDLEALDEEFASKIPGAFDQVKPQGENIGIDLATGILAGFMKALPTVETGMEKAMKSALNAMKSALEIHSPSKLMARLIGRPLADGIGVGISDGMTDVQRNWQAEMQKLSNIQLSPVQMAGSVGNSELSSITRQLENMTIEVTPIVNIEATGNTRAILENISYGIKQVDYLNGVKK